MSYNIKQLLVALVLLGAGLMSPSDSFDNKIDRDPIQILMETLMIIFAAAILLFYKKANKGKTNYN